MQVLYLYEVKCEGPYCLPYNIKVFINDFLHSIFLVKKIKISSIINNSIWSLYTSVVQKTNIFFIIVLQLFSFTLAKLVKSRTSFIFKIRIPSKVLFNLIVMQLMSCLHLLKVGKSVSLFTACQRNKYYSLIRSPFVFKKSQEQLMFNYYTGSLTFNCQEVGFFICEYVELLVLKWLHLMYPVDVKVFKSYNATLGGITQ